MSKVIGIDPGVATGIAVYNPSTKELEMCSSTDFWGAIEIIKKNPSCLFVIERSKTDAVWHSGAANQATRNKTAVNVGKVLREADLLIEFCHIQGIKCKTLHPVGKVNARYFKSITGWKGRTNEHARDAGMLCFGVNYP